MSVPGSPHAATPVGLVPVQLFGLEHLGAPDGWAFTVLATARPDLDPDRLRAALDSVVSYHAGLRLRTARDGSGAWRAEIRSRREPSFRVVDLAAAAPSERAAVTARVMDEERRGLDLDRGPVLRAVCLGAPGSWQVLLVAHHFVVDALSWSILLKDLEAAYEDIAAYETGHETEDGEYAAWTARLASRARSRAGRRAAEHWCGPDAPLPPAIPVDDPDAPSREGLATTVWVSLSPDQTAALQDQVRREPDADVQAVLAAAVHRAVEAWTGERRLGLWLLNHGRTSPVATRRTRRLIAFVTYSFPVVLDPAPDGGDVMRLAADLRRQVAAVPGGGIDYEICRYLGDDQLSARMAAVPPPGILLNYVGSIGGHLPGPLFTELHHEASIQTRDPDAARTLELEIMALIWDGSLHTTWTYVAGRHREATVAKLTRRFREALLEAAGA